MLKAPNRTNGAGKWLIDFEKKRCAMVSAFAPVILITASAPIPVGVDKAQMVSWGEYFTRGKIIYLGWISLFKNINLPP
jgi:hypothetical protein